MAGMVSSILNKIRGWADPEERAVTIPAEMGLETKALWHKVWYRGSVISLTAFHRSIGFTGNMFWDKGQKNSTIRMIHVDIPKQTVDKLSGMVVNDMLEPVVDKKVQDDWDILQDIVDLKSKLRDATLDVLVEGDGAFKLSWDTTISDYPILEFFPQTDVDYVYQKGHIVEVVFKERITHSSKDYILKYYYGRGYINHELFSLVGGSEKLVSLSETPMTADLVDLDLAPFGLDGVMLAVPYMIKHSKEFKGRGESIFEGKEQAFDELDEVASLWMDALRNNRLVKYIPMSQVPINPATGEIQKPDPFMQYVAIPDNMKEQSDNEIKTSQVVGETYDGYLNSFANKLDRALMGILSPSTLGIDLKKTDNATSQREKEKTTLYTRDEIVGVLEVVVPTLIQRILNVYDLIRGKSTAIYDVKVGFGQYASPSFDTQLETVGKARERNIISIPAMVEELWGDSQTPEWKLEEVARLEAEWKVINSLSGGNKPSPNPSPAPTPLAIVK